MSTIITSGGTAASGPRDVSGLTIKLLSSAAILTIAVAFVSKYVFRYYLHYSQAAFSEAAANYWVMRGWLLMHITGGMLALLTGPWQFWTGFRMRYARLHRWTGRLFLGGVATGSVAAVPMAITSTAGWAFGFSLIGLAIAWVTTSGMAYYAIRRRRIRIHQEWMVRAYVVTFAFVTFRVFFDYGPSSHLKPANDLAITLGWASWALPLLLAEVILQIRSLRSPVVPG